MTSRHLNGREPLEHSRHVPLRILTVGERLLLVAQGEAAEEDQAIRPIVLPETAGGPLAAGLLDDGEKVALDLHVAEERLEPLERRTLCRSPGRA